VVTPQLIEGLGPSVWRRLTTGALWNSSGVAIWRGLTLLTFILVARGLGGDGFGEFGLIHTTFSTSVGLASFGLGLTATRFVAQHQHHDPARTRAIVNFLRRVAAVGGLAGGFVLITVAGVIATQFFQMPQLAPLLRIAGLGVPFFAAEGAELGALAGLEAFKDRSLLFIVKGIWGIPLIVGGAFAGNVQGAVVGLVASSAIGWFLSYRVASRRLDRLDPARHGTGLSLDWGVLWRFSLPAVLAGAMVGPVNWLALAMLARESQSAFELGIYTAANQWFVALMFLPGVIGQAILPVMTEQHRGAEMGATAGIYRAAFLANGLLVIPVAISVAIGSPAIMRLYGEGFEVGWPVLACSVMAAALLAIQSPVGSLLAVAGRMWLGFLINTGWALAFLLGAWWLSPRGAIGLAFARTVAYGLHLGWSLAMGYVVVKSGVTR
jgi:EPS I polysaccharide export inner membrane protein EpsE